MDIRLFAPTLVLCAALSGCLGGQSLDLHAFEDAHYVTFFVHSDLSSGQTVEVAVFEGESVVAQRQYEAPGEGLSREPVLSLQILPATFEATVTVDGTALGPVLFPDPAGCRFNELLVEVLIDDDGAAIKSRCV